MALTNTIDACYEAFEKLATDNYVSTLDGNFQSTSAAMESKDMYSRTITFLKKIADTFGSDKQSEIRDCVDSLLGKNFFSEDPTQAFVPKNDKIVILFSKYCYYADLWRESLRTATIDTVEHAQISVEVKSRLQEVFAKRDLFKEFDTKYSQWNWESIQMGHGEIFSVENLRSLYSKIDQGRLVSSANKVRNLHLVFKKIVFCVQYCRYLHNELHQCSKIALEKYPQKEVFTNATHGFTNGASLEVSSPSDSDEQDPQQSTGAGLVQGTTGDLGMSTPSAANGAAGSSPSAANGAAGSSPSAANGAAGSPPSAANGAAGSSPSAANGAAGSPPSAANGAAGSSPSAANGAAGPTPVDTNSTPGSILTSNTPAVSADQLKAAMEERDRLQKSLHDITSERDNLKGQVGGLEAKIQEQEKKIEDMNKNHTQAIASLEASINELTEEKDQIIKESDNLKLEVQILRGQLALQTDELQALRAKESALKNQNELMSQLIDNYRTIADKFWPDFSKCKKDGKPLVFDPTENESSKWLQRLRELSSLIVNLKITPSSPAKNDLDVQGFNRTVALFQSTFEEFNKIDGNYVKLNNDLASILLNMTDLNKSFDNKIHGLSSAPKAPSVEEIGQIVEKKIREHLSKGFPAAPAPVALPTAGDISGIIQEQLKQHLSKVSPVAVPTAGDISGIIQEQLKQHLSKVSAVAVPTAKEIGDIVEAKLKENLTALPVEPPKNPTNFTSDSVISKPKTDEPKEDVEEVFEIVDFTKGDGAAPSDQPGDMEAVIQARIQDEIGKRLAVVFKSDCVDKIDASMKSQKKFVESYIFNVSTQMMTKSSEPKSHSVVLELVDYLVAKESELDELRTLLFANKNQKSPASGGRRF